MIMASAPSTPKAGWEVKTLGELCEILDSKRKPITKRNRVAGPFPYYGATGVLDHVEGFLFDEELVLVGEDGAKWGAGENSAFQISGKCWVNNHAHVLRPDRLEALDQWLISYLNYSDLDEYITGLTVPKLNQGKLREIPVPVPPLAEQERIVGILDEAFEGIAAATAQAEKNLHNARELFQSVLQSTFSQKGDDWEETTLGEVCELISGQHILAGDYNTTHKGIGYLTGPADFGEFNPIVSRWTEKPKSTAKSDDILITVKGSGVGKINILAEEEVAISRQLMAIRLNDTVSLKFIYFFMNMQFAFFQDLSTGAAIPGISRKDVLNLLLNLPPLPTQQAIVEKLDALSEETKALEAIYERKQSALAELKQSLLQKAFAGEL